MDWDGTKLTGIVNPGFEGLALQNAKLNAKDWTVHFELESKDASGKAVRCMVDGKIDKLGSDQRTLTGTWNCGASKQTFSLTRDRDYYRGVSRLRHTRETSYEDVHNSFDCDVHRGDVDRRALVRASLVRSGVRRQQATEPQRGRDEDRVE